MNKLADLHANIIHIDNLSEVEFDKNDLRCVECGSVLIPKRGKVKEWHFAHKCKDNCYYNGEMEEGYKTRGGESAVHKICKEIILKEKKLLVPIMNYNYKMMEFKNCIAEYGYENKRIDVVGITSTGKKVAIEIFYKHRVDDEKLNILKKGFDYVIEICVEDDYFKTYKDLESNIIDGEGNKRWLYLDKNTDIRIKSGYLELEHARGTLEFEKQKLKKEKDYFKCDYEEFNSWIDQKSLMIKEYENDFKRREKELKDREIKIEECENRINKYDLIKQYNSDRRNKVVNFEH